MAKKRNERWKGLFFWLQNEEHPKPTGQLASDTETSLTARFQSARGSLSLSFWVAPFSRGRRTRPVE